MRDEALYLADMFQRLRRIGAIVARGRAEFETSVMLQDAAMRSFTILGEAAKHVSDATRNRYPDVPWKRIAGLRDVLIHAYPRVRLDEVWEIAEREIPPLRERLAAILRERGIDPDHVPD